MRESWQAIQVVGIMHRLDSAVCAARLMIDPSSRMACRPPEDVVPLDPSQIKVSSSIVTTRAAHITWIADKFVSMAGGDYANAAAGSASLRRSMKTALVLVRIRHKLACTLIPLVNLNKFDTHVEDAVLWRETQQEMDSLADRHVDQSFSFRRLIEMVKCRRGLAKDVD